MLISEKNPGLINNIPSQPDERLINTPINSSDSADFEIKNLAVFIAK